MEEDKWVRSVRVRRGVGMGRGEVKWKERGGKGRVEDEWEEREERERKKGEVGRGGEWFCGDEGVGGREYSYIQKY